MLKITIIIKDAIIAIPQFIKPIGVVSNTLFNGL
jgi:hypothetical protein